jgi:uncharacterized integral membrane protein (TIGR00697 family)
MGNGQNRNYKFFTLLVAVYISCLLVASLLVHRLISVGGYAFSTSTLVFPFTYVLSDIITEVYGYKVSRQVIWAAFVSIFIFDNIMPLIALMPSSDMHGVKNAYDQVLSPLPRVFLGDFIALNVGAFTNAYLLSKWKILTQGKYFWMRSIGSTAVGEVAFTIIAFAIMFVGTIDTHTLLQAMVISYVFKIIFAIIIAFPGNVIASILKKVEKVDVFDYGINFNPFKMSA